MFSARRATLERAPSSRSARSHSDIATPLGGGANVQLISIVSFCLSAKIERTKSTALRRSWPMEVVRSA